MKNLILLMSLSVLMAFSLPLKAQTSELTKLDTEYEECLASGGNMYACAVNYYIKMDSLLNGVYNKLYSALDNKGKENLKEDEIQWLKKRDAEFKKIEDAIDPNGGYDALMIAEDSKAEFVKDRIILLSKRLEKLK